MDCFWTCSPLLGSNNIVHFHGLCEPQCTCCTVYLQQEKRKKLLLNTCYLTIIAGAIHVWVLELEFPALWVFHVGNIAGLAEWKLDGFGSVGNNTLNGFTVTSWRLNFWVWWVGLDSGRWACLVGTSRCARRGGYKLAVRYLNFFWGGGGRNGEEQRRASKP